MALILPGAVPVFNVILAVNFFKALPREIEEAAFIDGASYWGTLIKIIIPLSLPVIATITLFQFVGHWNDWFSGMIYMDQIKNYPLQTLLQTVISSANVKTLDQAKNYTILQMHQKCISKKSIQEQRVYIQRAKIFVWCSL